MVFSVSWKLMTGQLESVERKTLVLIAVHLTRSVEVSMTLVWPGRPLNTVNSMAPLPEARGKLSIGVGAAATRTAITFSCRNERGPLPPNPPSIRSPPAELLTV